MRAFMAPCVVVPGDGGEADGYFRGGPRGGTGAVHGTQARRAKDYLPHGISTVVPLL